MVFVTLERRATENLGINPSYKKIVGDNPQDAWIWAVRYHLRPAWRRSAAGQDGFESGTRGP